MVPQHVPEAVFRTRIRNEALGVDNPFEWKDVTSYEVFAGKRIVLFAVPGAFTPACSDDHLPGFETHYDDFRALGIDQVVCLLVNDAFVMHQWAKSRQISKLYMLPDGNGEFTRKMGMLVERTRTGMGLRSWRYSMLVEDMEIRRMFVEPGFRDEPEGVPLKVSGAVTILRYLQGN